MKLHYGFFEFPNVPVGLAAAKRHGLVIEPDMVTFFVGRETLVPAVKPVLKPWRIALYTWLPPTPIRPRGSSNCPPTGWSSSARRSPSDASVKDERGAFC